jgi:IclR family pca regulon transcriptional regulator
VSPRKSPPTGAVSPHKRPPTDVGEEWESVPRLREARYSQSLERGLTILECFTPERPVWGIAELADELGMSRSTTHRYALTLTELGYLVRAARRRYRLGLRVTDLGLATVGSISLREHARPHLEELARRAPYALAVGVLDGPEVLCVDCVHGSRRWLPPPDLGLFEGARLPIHCTALGRLLAAHLPERELHELLAGLTLRRRGPRTLTSRAALRRALTAIRDVGLVRGEDELGEGVYEIAAPVRWPAGEVYAALSMMAHRSMLSPDELAGHLGPHLIATADRVSAQLGYRRADERPVGPGPSRECSC